MKITHTNDIIDLGEFKDIDKKDVKKFLDKAIKIIITEDNKTINKYEDISYHTCISCGKPAKYLSTGWICPYCEKCAPRGSKLMK